MTRLWNGQPFKNYWIELSVEKRSEKIKKAELEKIIKPTTKWEDLQTHHQALLRDVLRSEVE